MLDDAAKDPINDTSQTPPCLSPKDQAALKQLADKLQIVRDRVAGVAKHYITGLILTGRGGTGKSWTVIEELERLQVPFVLHNSHLTPRGLFDQLDENPAAVHVIEDAEPLARNTTALGVLRSATWGTIRNREGRIERRVTWRTHCESIETIFSGGVILISNREIGRMPEMMALATRVPHIELTVDKEEIAALMRKVALRGHRVGDAYLEPEDCLEVAEFIISESATLSRPLDMRIFVIGCADRLQVEDCDAGCSWKDLIGSLLRGHPTVAGDIEAVGIREQTKARELAIAREIGGIDPKERLGAWKERTGKSQAVLYRRLAELGRIDALGQ